jgi:uncharacterized protein YpmB
MAGMTTVLIVLIIAIAFVASQVLVTRMQTKQRESERAEDIARQDLVAARATEVAMQAAEAANLLLERQQLSDKAAANLRDRTDEVARIAAKASTELMSRTDEVARVAAESDHSTKIQLHQIHVLVNSELTASRTREMERTIELASSKRKIIRLHEEAGTGPTPDELADVEAMERKIDELRAILADRLVQQRIVEADQREQNTD